MGTPMRVAAFSVAVGTAYLARVRCEDVIYDRCADGVADVLDRDSVVARDRDQRVAALVSVPVAGVEPSHSRRSVRALG